MSWNYTEAKERIETLCNEAPKISVQRFNDYLPDYNKARMIAEASGDAVTPPLFKLPRGSAIIVDTIQIYASIVNYDEYKRINGEESEEAHEQSLRASHLFYTVADRVIGESIAQRVDFHSGRVHAVVVERGAKGVSADAIQQAFAFVDDLTAAVTAANDELAAGDLHMQLRIGLDAGTCVAINNGTGTEQEPMFLGSAANHAAKLANGNEAGVFASDRLRDLLGYQSFADHYGHGERQVLKASDVAKHAGRDYSDTSYVGAGDSLRAFTDSLIGNIREDIAKGELPDYSNPSFSFFYQTPPLKAIKYQDLSPSKTIRIDLASLFADLTGYTKYIDNAVENGEIDKAVLSLYVIRQEFQNVVEEDFKGRKVRFIGDCIHAIIAEGDNFAIDKAQSVSAAALCASGLHGSFALCQSIIGEIDNLGLAIGIEFGPTPVSRIGIRGERSVRIASSIATAISEKMQRDCNDGGVKFGPVALAIGPIGLRDHLDNWGFSESFAYDDVAIGLSADSTEVKSPYYARAHADPEPVVPRAHMTLK